MNYIKTFESFNSDDISAVEHFDKIVDILKHNGKSLNNINIVNDVITYGDSYTISLDKYGFVTVC